MQIPIIIIHLKQLQIKKISFISTYYLCNVINRKAPKINISRFYNKT